MSDYYKPPATLPPGSLVWAYVRDSGGTEQEQSTGQQEAELKAYCKTWGLILDNVFADVGKSAKTTKGRDQFNAMIDSITADNHPAGLLLWSFSRFSRNIDDSAYFRSHLRRHGVVIHSLTEKIPEGLAGRIIESVQDYSNADFLEQQSKHIKRALETNVRAGFAPGGFPPRGYRAEKVVIGEKRDKSPRTVSRWIPDPDLFPLVQLAWKLRAEGKPYAEITKATGGKVYTSINSWSSFFRNRTYLGVMKCGDVEVPGTHDPAVSLEDFQKVQALNNDKGFRHRGLTHPRRARYPSLLSGLAYCAKCGAAFIHHRGTKKYPNSSHYLCGTRDRKHGVKSCNIPRFRSKTLDTLVLDAVLNKILTPTYAEEILDELQTLFSDTDSIANQIKLKRTALNETKRAIQNLLELAETFGVKSAVEKLKQRETEETILESEIQAMIKRKENSEIEITPEALQVVITAWRDDIIQARETENVLALRSLLSRFVTKIELGYHQVIISYTFPMTSNSPIVSNPPRGAKNRRWAVFVLILSETQ